MPSKNKSGAHDDDVFPMALADRRHATLGLVLSVTFRFEAVLDTEKLRKALGVLVETGGWRKLGARARSWVRLDNPKCRPNTNVVIIYRSGMSRASLPQTDQVSFSRQQHMAAGSWTIPHTRLWYLMLLPSLHPPSQSIDIYLKT